MTVSLTPAPAVEVPGLPDGALQVLALAQRTADDHIAAAQVLAEQIHQEARAYAAEMRAEADRMMADARAEAERIVAGGGEYADQLKLRAQQRYEDAVGGLATKRAALQQQIEALATFDNDYRQRITSFLQGQLRALWAEQPEPVDLPEIESQMPGGPVGGPGAY